MLICDSANPYTDLLDNQADPQHLDFTTAFEKLVNEHEIFYDETFLPCNCPYLDQQLRI